MHLTYTQGASIFVGIDEMEGNMSVKITKQDWVIGAIWRMAARKHLHRGDVLTLLMDRAKLPKAKAVQLASHWFRSRWIYGKAA